jgi:hypothetical protein
MCWRMSKNENLVRVGLDLCPGSHGVLSDPAAPPHRLQQDARQTPVCLQWHPLEDEIDRLYSRHAFRRAGVRSLCELAEATLPEADDDASADRIGSPALDNLSKELLLVGGVRQALWVPEDCTNCSVPAPAGGRVPHLVDHALDQLVADLSSKTSRALPELEHLVAEVDLAIAELAYQNQLLRVAVNPQQ